MTSDQQPWTGYLSVLTSTPRHIPFVFQKVLEIPGVASAEILKNPISGRPLGYIQVTLQPKQRMTPEIYEAMTRILGVLCLLQDSSGGRHYAHVPTNSTIVEGGYKK